MMVFPPKKWPVVSLILIDFSDPSNYYWNYLKFKILVCIYVDPNTLHNDLHLYNWKSGINYTTHIYLRILYSFTFKKCHWTISEIKVSYLMSFSKCGNKQKYSLILLLYMSYINCTVVRQENLSMNKRTDNMISITTKNHCRMYHNIKKNISNLKQYSL